MFLVTISYPDDPDRGFDTYGPFSSEPERDEWVTGCQEAASLGYGLLHGAVYRLHRAAAPFDPTSLMQDGFSSRFCEDYPCCGHTDADPCEPQGYDAPGAFDTSRPGNEHALCEHEAGICYVPDPDEDDDDEDMFSVPASVLWAARRMVRGGFALWAPPEHWVWCFACRCWDPNVTPRRPHVHTEYTGPQCATPGCAAGTLVARVGAPGYGSVRVCRDGHREELSPTGVCTPEDVI